MITTTRDYEKKICMMSEKKYKQPSNILLHRVHLRRSRMVHKYTEKSNIDYKFSQSKFSLSFVFLHNSISCFHVVFTFHVFSSLSDFFTVSAVANSKRYSEKSQHHNFPFQKSPTYNFLSVRM